MSSFRPDADGADRVVIEFPASDGYRGVGRLVLGGLASRFDLPVDRMEELLLAVESVCAQDGELAGDVMRVEALAGADRLEVLVGPFRRSLSGDGAVWRILEALVETVGEHEDEDGSWVRLETSVSRVGGRLG
jgi:hypothetical protein